MDKDIRDGYFDTLSSMAVSDDNFIIISDDMDVFGLRSFKELCPHRFINAGVAEQNIINVAAGLASCGKSVYVFGIAPFITMRCFEQIKFNLCSMNLPVTLIGVGSGISFSFDGPTHHGMHDVSIMRTLPEMTIFNPCDAMSAKKCAEHIPEGPVYVRLDKGRLPTYYCDDDDTSWKEIQAGDNVCIVSTGYMTQVAVEASCGIEGLSVIDVCCIKPLLPSILDELSTFDHVVVLEENAETGGLGSAILELSSSLDVFLNITRLSLPDQQFLSYGKREWFHKQCGIDAASVSHEVKRIVDEY